MTDKKRPDAKTFLEDPAFQADREIMGAFVDAHIAKKIEAEKAARAEADKNKKPESAFSFLDSFPGFGGESN